LFFGVFFLIANCKDMSGALVNLVAKGAQDAFLTGTPEVSFFQSMYKRYSNFSQFPVELNTIGTAAASSTISIPIQRKGDLLSYMWIDLGSGTVATELGMNTANPAVFRLYVGGQLVEEHDAFYASKLYSKFLANTGSKTTSGRNAASLDASTILPIHFSFCDDYALSLPLVALQYHDVEVRVQFNSGIPTTPKFYANYIQLDSDERAKLAREPMEMLITQVQRIQKDTNTKVDLSYFNHPVKALLWGSSDTGTLFTFADAKLTLNGVDVFDPMPQNYFSHVQTYHHSTNGSDLQAGATGEAAGLFMYSFALKADRYQPCGTCNFSRLDNAELKFGTTTNDAQFNWFYAVNYNVFRIQNGLGGLAFSS